MAYASQAGYLEGALTLLVLVALRPWFDELTTNGDLFSASLIAKLFVSSAYPHHDRDRHAGAAQRRSSTPQHPIKTAHLPQLDRLPANRK